MRYAKPTVVAFTNASAPKISVAKITAARLTAILTALCWYKFVRNTSIAGDEHPARVQPRRPVIPPARVRPRTARYRPLMGGWYLAHPITGRKAKSWSNACSP